MEKRFIEQVLRFKAAILVATLVLTGVAGVYATRVQFDSSIEIWFLEKDPKGYGFIWLRLTKFRLDSACPDTDVAEELKFKSQYELITC